MNTGKQINAMVLVLFLVLIAVGAYTIWDPFRSDAAKTTQDDTAATFGAQTFTLNCRLCHGDRGQGGQSGGRLAAAPALDRPEFQGIDKGAFSQSTFDINLRLITNTITCGRAGTFMPTWGASQGGTLSDEQIRQLVVLITEGHWDLAQEHADQTDATTTNNATVQMSSGSLSADATELTVSNAGPFTLGQYVRIDGERMRVLPKQLDVQRGVDGTEAADHKLGAAILRNGTPVLGKPAPTLSRGAVVLMAGPAATLAEKAAKDASAFAVGDTSGFAAGDTLQVDDETVRVTGISRGIPTTGQVLAKAMGRTPKTILVSGPQGIQEGTLVRIDSELMTVTAVGNDGNTGTELDANATATDAELSVNKPTFFRPDYQVRVGDEMMRVVGPVDTGQTLAVVIGTAQTTLSVSGTASVEQGMIVRIDDELFRVKQIVQPARLEIDRGVDGTPAASHTSGVAVLKAVKPPAEGQPPEDATTGQTLLADVTADATTIDVSATTKLAVDQKYKLDDETVQIKSFDPALLKVERAVGGTKKAAHSRRASIYDGNKLEVKRGVDGTAASAHNKGDMVYMTALKIKREAEGSTLAEHAKNTELFLGNQLVVARGVLTTQPAEHKNDTLVRNFPAPPDSPATNLGPTCSMPQVQPGATSSGPAPTAIAGATKVAVSLTEFKVTTDIASAPAGGVEFDLTNIGSAPHNFRIIKTELDPTKLPVANSQVDESQVDVVGGFTTPGIQAGENRVVPANLVPGNYVLICNVPTHYQSGMHIAFTVQ
jgi:mono/diheme cytochrome c family protein